MHNYHLNLKNVVHKFKKELPLIGLMNFVLLVVSIIEHHYQSFLSSNENAFLQENLSFLFFTA